MSKVGEIVEYGAFGIGLTLFLYVIFGFAPSLMVSLSIADTLGSWTVTETKHVSIPEQVLWEPGDKYYKQPKEWAEWWNEDPVGSGKYYKTETTEGWASVIWGCAFGALIAVQMALQANFRRTWGIVIVWWLFSIYPFLNWFCWFYTSFGETPFPGIDWIPFI